MASGGSSSGSSQTSLATLSPFLPMLADMFGMDGMEVDPITGGFRWGENEDVQTPFGNILGGADDPRFGGGGITGLIQNAIFGEGATKGLGIDADTVGGMMEQLLGSLGAASFTGSQNIGQMAEMARTGNIDDAVNLANVTLRDQLMPTLKEDFGAKFGLDTRDSDMQAAGLRGAEQMAAQLGNLGQDRKLQAGQALGGLLGTQGNLLGTGAGLLGSQFDLSNMMRQEDPSRQVFNTLMGMAGGNVQTGTGGSSRQRSVNVGIMSCWVAAEFFGWFTPSWWAARNWIMEGWQGDEADSFRDLYLQHGPEMAAQVRQDPSYADKLRPLFEWARRMGHSLLRS